LGHLQTEFGVSGTALTWLHSYLGDQSQFVKLGQHWSPTVSLQVRVPQGPELGPLLFAVYCNPVVNVTAETMAYNYYQYADNTQLYFAMLADIA